MRAGLNLFIYLSSTVNDFFFKERKQLAGDIFHGHGFKEDTVVCEKKGVEVAPPPGSGQKACGNANLDEFRGW